MPPHLALHTPKPRACTSATLMLQHRCKQSGSAHRQAPAMRAPAHREVVVSGRDDRKGRRLAPRARLIQRLRAERGMQQIPLGALARLASSKLDLKQRIAISASANFVSRMPRQTSAQQVALGACLCLQLRRAGSSFPMYSGVSTAPCHASWHVRIPLLPTFRLPR